jgi:diadenosine tetraphosphate (Ap4A) HIT family hydrolase
LRLCEIATGNEPAEIVAEDDRALVFLDHAPANDGHTLDIPPVLKEGLTIERMFVSVYVPPP